MRFMLSHKGCLQATVRGRGGRGEDLHHWSGMRLSDSLTTLLWGCLCWAVAYYVWEKSQWVYICGWLSENVYRCG